MINERLRRVTDLFVEGVELPMGAESDGTPVVIWINKLNSFEQEEVRRDAVAKRGMRIATLSNEDNPELIALQATIKDWSSEQLAQARVNQLGNDLYLQGINLVEGDAKMREKVDLVRRAPELLQGVPQDDEQWKTVQQAQRDYMKAIQGAVKQLTDERLEDLKQVDDTALEDDYIEAWRQAQSVDVFVEQTRIGQLYHAMRDCVATRLGGKWDHSKCDHSSKLLESPADARALPEEIIRKASDKLDEITVGPRDSGNSDAPASSSASSEPQSEEEDLSPSIPVETPSAAPQT